MNLHNIRITVRLRIALGIILALIALLAWESKQQLDELWTHTTMLYNHPLTVRRAIGVFDTAITAIHRDMRSLALVANNEAKIAMLLEEIDLNKSDAFKQLAIVEERYLGPREDIEQLHAAFTKWNTIRDETLRLLRQGKNNEVAERTNLGGVGDNQARQLHACTHKVETFAKGKADQIYKDASHHQQALSKRLYVYISTILSFSLLLIYFIVAWIRNPLRKLTETVGHFRVGNLSIRTGITSKTEFGTLAAAFDAMADTLQTEMYINDKSARIAGIMLQEMDARSFCKTMITALVEDTDSQLGAVYLLNPSTHCFEHFESIGLDTNGRAAFSADLREGEFGRALATGKIQHITAIPDTTAFSFATVNGAFKPCEIMTIPVCSGAQICAMISLARLQPYDAKARGLVQATLDTITARMNGVLLFQQIQEQAKRLEVQNQELEAQKTELSTQTNELIEMNAELEMQQRELEQASQLKSIFLANMSHELRTPLNSVIALSGVLERRLTNKIPKEEFSYLEVIERNGKHLLELINDILDLSRIEAGREELTLSTFSVSDVVNPIMERLNPLAQEKGLSLTHRMDAELPMLLSDSDKIQHILQNLVSNAIKFTEKGSVEVATFQQNGKLNIAVRDTGMGIPTEAHATIFEAFRQVDDSASRRHDGTGLGLTLARKYARLLEGDIAVESVLGKGSTFRLWLPLHLAHADERGTPAQANQQPTCATTTVAGTPRNLLLVEDSEAIVIQMTDMLTEQGYVIRTAKNGIEALARIEEALPDAIILDLMMPEMNGFDTLKVIRNSEKTAALPVLILTARHVSKDELSFLKSNHISQLIRKGDIRRTELLSAVAAMLQPSPKEKLDPQQHAQSRRQPISGRPTVMVIEDNPDNLKTMHALLCDRCTLIEVSDGQTGINEAKVHKPDIILTDLALPVMDGFAVLAAIRADETLRDTPVVAVTARAMKGERETILTHGFDGYLSKPIITDELMQIFQDLFGSTMEAQNENTGN